MTRHFIIHENMNRADVLVICLCGVKLGVIRRTKEKAFFDAWDHEGVKFAHHQRMGATMVAYERRYPLHSGLKPGR